MKITLKTIIIIFHIYAALFFLTGLAMSTSVIKSLLGISTMWGWFFIVMGVLIEIVIKGLKEKKYWAWVAGIVISALSIPSFYFIFGILGLIGLLNKDTKQEFKK